MKQINAFSLICIIFFFTPSYSQKYITSAGVRASKNEIGLSIQQKIYHHFTIEPIIAKNNEETYASLLIEHHQNILWGERFNAYFGAGPRYGFYEKDSAYFATDLIVGVEYKILLLPIVLSADIKPAIKFTHSNFFELGVGISIRYIFIKEKKKKLFNKK